MDLNNPGPNGPKWEGYYCSKEPWGCVKGQCIQCSFYKKAGKVESLFSRFIRWALRSNERL